MIKIALMAAAAVAFLVTYSIVLKTYLAAHAAAVDKESAVSTATGLTKVWVILDGWKTLICNWFAAMWGILAAIPSETYQAWSQLPFASIIDQHVAAGLAIAFTFAGTIFHVQGLAKSAETPPQN